MELRDYQIETVTRCRQAIKRGCRNLLLVAPTGSGKTVMATHLMNLAADRFNHSLFLAHRREIVHQTADKLKRFGCHHGIEMAGEARSHAPIIVGSVQTFLSRYINGTRNPPRADVLFFDEAHRSLAVSYQKVRAMYPEAILIGMTATPVRGDGKGLGSMYNEMVETVSVEQLMEAGWLVRPRVFAPSMPELKNVKIKRGEYDKTDLEDAMDIQELVGNVITDWKARAGDRRTVVFASGVRHSKHLAQEFERIGVRVAHIDGETPKHKRDEVLSQLAAGEIQVVTNCDVLLEGWDCPDVSCCVLARPTKSYGLYLQMAGRVLRPADGKSDCMVIDHAGAVYSHGFVEDAGEWSLDPDTPIEERRKKAEEKTSQPVTCRECFTVYDGQASCPNCGWLPTKQAKEVNMAEGRLKEVKRVQKKKDTRQKFWNECLWKSIRKGLKIGAAAHMYRKKMGVWPHGLKTVPTDKTEWGMGAREFYEYWKDSQLGNNKNGEGVQDSLLQGSIRGTEERSV